MQVPKVKYMLVYQKSRNSMTPKELMISRYEAFVQHDWDYLVKTSLYQTKEELSAPSSIEWLKLEVVDAQEDTVEFKAYYKENARVGVLHEKSKFVLVDNEWKYKDGTLFNTQIQRNEPCPCGSGKKYKKCCVK
jgi:SEC-C motif-containing protein